MPIFLFAAIAFLGGCGALDTILPSAGTYRVNARVNDASLDDFSFVTYYDEVRPFFELSVSDDPDVTALMVFFRDAKGEIASPRVLYTIDTENAEEQSEEDKDEQEDILSDNGVNINNDDDYYYDDYYYDYYDGDDEKLNEDDDEENPSEETEAEDAAEDEDASDNLVKNGELLVIPVKNLDNVLPLFPIPAGMPIGRYTLVFQVMGEDTVLFKAERSFYYLADAKFSFDGIQVHMPGIATSTLIPQGSVIMLEAKLDFDNRLDPYIVWYNGRRIISEGIYSEGAGNLLWKAPEQSGFFSLSAEAFPLLSHQGLTGYQKGISLLVSTRNVDMNFLSEDISNLIKWYTFEGDINDAIMPDSEERVLTPTREKQSLLWMPFGGTYGLVTGPNNAFTLPDITILDTENESRQMAFRFKPLNEGVILSVEFDSSTITLSNTEENLILTLASSQQDFSETVALPETDSFITAAINLTIQSGRLYAKFFIIEDINNLNEPAIYQISLDVGIQDEFKIMLGSEQNSEQQNSGFTAIWDEFALLGISVDIIEEEPLEETPPASEEEEEEHNDNDDDDDKEKEENDPAEPTT